MAFCLQAQNIHNINKIVPLHLLCSLISCAPAPLYPCTPCTLPPLVLSHLLHPSIPCALTHLVPLYPCALAPLVPLHPCTPCTIAPLAPLYLLHPSTPCALTSLHPLWGVWRGVRVQGGWGMQEQSKLGFWISTTSQYKKFKQVQTSCRSPPQAQNFVAKKLEPTTKVTLTSHQLSILHYARNFCSW